MFIGQHNFISHAFLFGEYLSWSLAFKLQHGAFKINVKHSSSVFQVYRLVATSSLHRAREQRRSQQKNYWGVLIFGRCLHIELGSIILHFYASNTAVHLFLEGGFVPAWELRLIHFRAFVLSMYILHIIYNIDRKHYF